MLLAAMTAAGPAVSQKQGGILRAGHFDSPASVSMLEPVDTVGKHGETELSGASVPKSSQPPLAWRRPAADSWVEMISSRVALKHSLPPPVILDILAC